MEQVASSIGGPSLSVCGGEKTQRHRVRRLSWMGILPALLFLSIVFVIPVGALVRRSVFDPSITWEHYARIVREPIYVNVLWITFKIAIIVTLSCVIIGYPMAYATYRVHGRWKWLLLGFVLLPFWTSLLVRTFAFMLLLQRQGVINRALLTLHLIDEPIPMVYNLTGVLVGMTYMLLPYMILPIYSVLDRIDPLLELSAVGLGASRFRAFTSTVLPLSVPGIVAGASLVFLLALGFFVTPALLGGRKEQMLSMVIEAQVNEILNWGFASALCVLLIVATAVFALLLSTAAWCISRKKLLVKEPIG